MRARNERVTLLPVRGRRRREEVKEEECKEVKEEEVKEEEEVKYSRSRTILIGLLITWPPSCAGKSCRGFWRSRALICCRSLCYLLRGLNTCGSSLLPASC
jgi:hypothetical protein